MREIEFRGRSYNKQWVFGYYIKHLDYTPFVCDYDFEEDYKHLIVKDEFSDWGMPRDTENFLVDGKTVGMYSNKTDKYNEKIFEGDIINETYTSNNKTFSEIWLVKYDGYYGWICDCLSSNKKSVKLYNLTQYITIIGNIHDNPELIKSK